LPAPVRSEVSQEPDYLSEPTLSFLACTTPALFWQHIRDVNLHSGFVNRACFLTGPVKPPISLPEKPDVHALRLVTDALTRLSSIALQEAVLDPEARQVWQDFYRVWCETDLEPLVKAATERIPAYCLKLAMTYAALEQTLPMISAEQLKAAIAVGRYAVHCAGLLIGQRVSTRRQSTCEDAVHRVYRDAGKPFAVWKVHQRVGDGSPRRRLTAHIGPWSESEYWFLRAEQHAGPSFSLYPSHASRNGDKKQKETKT
jgi:hypothetical protein